MGISIKQPIGNIQGGLSQELTSMSLMENTVGITQMNTTISERLGLQSTDMSILQEKVGRS